MNMPIKMRGETIFYEYDGLVHEVEDLYAQRTCWTWCNMRFDIDDLDKYRAVVTCLWCAVRAVRGTFD